MEIPEDSDLRRQVEVLAAQVKLNRVDIEAWTARAVASEERADIARRRADEMEARAAVDREMIAELQAEGVHSQEHVAQLEAALATSRVIGAAIGILMANRNIGQEEAVALLKGASQRSNVKMRDVAAMIVAGADAIK